MQTGVIVYIVDAEVMGDDFDIDQAIKRLDLKADRVEVVSPHVGHFDVMDACWLLMAKGMKLVVCMLAQIESHSKLKLSGCEFRLCG